MQDLRAAVAALEPTRRPPDSPDRRAAVAAVLREGEHGVELLFIHRAEDPRDPWSGHMAFPGGRVDAGDRDSLAAAVREAEEELSLDLACHGRYLGRLSDVTAVARGRRLGLVIEVFAFELSGDPPLRPNREVQEALWVPLEFFMLRENRSTLQWKYGDVSVPLPCYRYRGRVIWGLTFGMVHELVTILSPDVG
jgi:8-oxo-dGTP pyrophosphatase MutT (NUDIX family)